MRILLIEDNEAEIFLTKVILEQSNKDVTLEAVRDGVAALEYFLQKQESADTSLPDMILLDLNMPRMNGYEFLEASDKQTSLALPPVVILSNSEHSDEIMAQYPDKIVGYMVKPLNPDSLQEYLGALA